MKGRVLIASPRIGDLTSPTGFASKPSEAANIANLTELVRSQLGEETPITTVGYSTTKGQSHLKGTVPVEYPKSGEKIETVLVDGRKVNFGA